MRNRSLNTVSTIPDDADRVLVAVNPKAGRRSSHQLVGNLASLLKRCRLDVHVRSDLDQIADLAQEWHQAGTLRAVVGIGGDGTAAELTNRTNEGIPITLLACGTANVLAKHTGLCGRPHRLCETIMAGRTISFDVGRAGARLFLAMLGCGFDADVVGRVHEKRSSGRGGHISYLSYVKPILDSIRNYDYPAIRVRWNKQPDDREEEPNTLAKWVFIFNLPRYGWGLPLAPAATPHDGVLDLCAFERGSWWSGMYYAGAAHLGLHRRMGGCLTGRGQRFRIESDEPVSYQLDGDPGGILPVDVEILPGRLTLLVPASAPAARNETQR